MMHHFHWAYPHPRPDADPEAIITLFNGQANLTFNDTGKNLALALPIITQLLAKRQNIVAIECMYPLSGQYDFLPRILFYLCVVFAILLRHRTWIAKVALGFVMSYSGTACIHLSILLGHYHFKFPINQDGFRTDPMDSTGFGDVDFWGIAPVVATSAIMLIPVLHWSSSHQWKEGRAVLLYWSYLIIVTFGVVVVYVFGWGKLWYVNRIESIALCNSDCNPRGPKLPSGQVIPFVATLDQYMECDCTDFCGLLSPRAPLRAKEGMVAHLVYDSTQKISCKDSYCDHGTQAAGWFQTAVFTLWAIAFGQSILAFICINSNTEAVRNRIFRIMNAGRRHMIMALFKGRRREHVLERFHLTESCDPKKPHRQMRRIFARLPAVIFYIVAFFGLFASPILFILSIILLEIFLSTANTSERSDAIGSWGPWVAAALVFIAALINKYHRPIAKIVSRQGRHIRYWIQYDAEDRRKKLKEDSDRAEASSPKSMTKSSWKHCRHTLEKSWWHLRIRWKAFWAWLNDPETLSAKEYAEPIKNRLASRPVFASPLNRMQ